jgi:hypothetical protein
MTPASHTEQRGSAAIKCKHNAHNTADIYICYSSSKSNKVCSHVEQLHTPACAVSALAVAPDAHPTAVNYFV